MSDGTPLGALLIREGFLTEAQVDAALNEQARSGKQLGRILIESGTISETDLVRTLDQVALGVSERLYVRAPFSVEGEATYPVDVVVRTEGADDAAKVRYVLQIRQRRN